MDDFHNLNLTSSQRSENIRENSQDKSFPSLSSGAVQGLLGGLPDLKSKKKGKQPPKKRKKEDPVTEAFEKLREQTREEVRGLESTIAAASKVPNLGVDGLGKEDVMMDDWVKQFEEMIGS
ncbi:peroxisome biogenesis protein 19-2-like [Papaver somniferum]|uniref:peroxisome biogenesis protein 19-2-like n=1 Tax=Papaver somniferum TaxID=3469 RepID=UPI000E6F6A18|nr:peroxisome biogenesis protein 19-2-like [Papaver somniferum]